MRHPKNKHRYCIMIFVEIWYIQTRQAIRLCATPILSIAFMLLTVALFGPTKAAAQGETLFALGNRVWFDTDNSGTINNAEVGIDGVTLRHRITLVTGPVRSIVVSEASGRKHFVVDGPAIRRLGDPRLRGEPDQAVADADIAALLDGTARFAPMGPGSFELLGLVDGVVAPRRDRVAPAPRDPEDTASPKSSPIASRWARPSGSRSSAR